jgi:hypothetical protein
MASTAINCASFASHFEPQKVKETLRTKIIEVRKSIKMIFYLSMNEIIGENQYI